ncbi:MAG: threonine--tRNA ligase [Nanoarchaeota archaeon]|nr:threonine--tRNA ligase [Nanoarchaeota archaeon]
MKILTLHCDYIKFKALKKALKSVEDVESKEVVVKGNPLVVLTAVEKGDNEKDSVDDLIKEIVDIAERVKTDNIVLYPYAHLSSNLGSPDLAIEILKKAEEELKNKNFKVSVAPFGYYKEFELKVKGHPLSELSREIVSGVEGEDEESYNVKNLLRSISKTTLDREKLKDNDHRIIGRNLDLFSFNETAPGMVFFHNNGLIIWNEIIKYWKEVHEKAGYHEIRTPQILDEKLWKISGHWEKYKENIFLTEYEKRMFAVKPMNCPGGMLVYKNSSKSYKDFPLRVAELGIVHRQELSGVLSGLFRVIQFTQDDAHIYCTEEQIEEEVVGIMKLVDEIYKKFGMKFRVELSTRPEKRIGSDDIWDKTEKILERVLKKQKVNFKINKGDGAFYGPKIDFHLKDSLGREWQTATIQLDMSMPERFELEYTDKDNKKKRPLMLHRTVLGGIERFYGILVEHLNGAFPTWLSPIQVRVINFTDRNTKAAEKIVKELKEAGIRVDFDFESTRVNEKVRDASILKIPFIVTVGDKEEKDGTLAVRTRDGKLKYNVKVTDFIKEIKKLIEERN